MKREEQGRNKMLIYNFVYVYTTRKHNTLHFSENIDCECVVQLTDTELNTKRKITHCNAHHMRHSALSLNNMNKHVLHDQQI